MRFLLLLLLSLPCYATNIIVHKTPNCCTGAGLGGDTPDSGETLNGSFSVSGNAITDWTFRLDGTWIYPHKGNFLETAEIISPTHYRFTHLSTPFATTVIDLEIPSLTHDSPVSATVLAEYTHLWFQGTGLVVPEPSTLLLLLCGLSLIVLDKYKRYRYSYTINNVMEETMRTVTAAILVPFMKLTGYRFSKIHRQQNTWQYRTIDTVQANVWAGLEI